MRRDSEEVSPDDRSDEDLLAAVADQDLGALQVLHDRHVPWARGVLRRRCADPDVVAEVTQDTFSPCGKGLPDTTVGVRSRRGSGGSGSDSSSAACAPTRFHSLDHGRAWWRSSAASEPRDQLQSAEEAVLLGVEHGELHGALARLSPELRAVMQATVLDGLFHTGAARLLGIPTGTVKTRMRRARLELRGALS